MKTKTSFLAILAIATGTLLGAASGCELIAGVDRNKIESTGTGGSTTTGTTTVGGGGTGGTMTTGGTGGTTTTGGTGGCMMDSQCPDPMEDCQVAKCDTATGMCGKAAAADGTDSSMQITGDCKKNVCMGGVSKPQNDDTDKEDDGTACTDDTCDMGTPKHTPGAAGVMCTDAGGKVCDDTGKCVECIDNTTCTDGNKPVCDTPNHVCVTQFCMNNMKDKAETDIDCGGPDCAKCADDLACGGAGDCLSNNCVSMKCVAGTCGDGIKNNVELNETDVDCGGDTCPKCKSGKICKLNLDCRGGDCDANGTCKANCMDAEKDQDETDVDCGGGTCATKCGNNQGCGVGSDCTSGFCKDNAGVKTCQPCGADGDCSAAQYCNAGACVADKANGATCSKAAECPMDACVDGVCCGTSTCGTCQSCGLSGSEGTCTALKNSADPDSCTGTQSCDGAGVCKKIDGQVCAMGTDCLNGNCVDGVCCNSACTAACKSCAVAGSVGTCSNLVNAVDNFPANVCNGNNICDAGGACKKAVGQACPGGNSDCANGQCVDGFCCGSATCPTCQTCGGGTPGSCTAVGNGLPDVGTCDSGSVCDGSLNGATACKKGDGLSCAGGVDADCFHGHCTDGFCCNAACGGLCQACNVAGSNGNCTPIPAGADPAGECNGGAPADLCNGALACGAGASGVPCVSGAGCASGTCQANNTCL